MACCVKKYLCFIFLWHLVVQQKGLVITMNRNVSALYLKKEVIVDAKRGVMYKMVLPFKDSMSVRDFRILSKMSAFLMNCFQGGNTVDNVALILSNIVNCNILKAQIAVSAFTQKFQDCLSTDVMDRDRDEKAEQWVKNCILPRLDYRNGRFEIPLSITCILTEACDKRCKYCFYDAGGKDAYTRTMSRELGHEIIDEAGNLGIQTITFTGGEPMLYKDLLEVLCHCKEKNIETILTTRGGPDPEMAKELADAGLSQATVGLDAATEKVAEQLSATSNIVANTSEFIRILVESKIRVKVLCIVSKINYSEILKMVDLCLGLGVSTLVFRECAESFGRNDENILLTEKERDEIETWLSDLDTPTMDIHFTKRIMNMDVPVVYSTTCRMGRHVMTVRYDGKVIMCDTMIHDDRLIVGDLSTQTIYDVWHSEAMMNFINPERNEFSGTMCAECLDFDRCNKPQCVYASILANGRLRSALTQCENGRGLIYSMEGLDV